MECHALSCSSCARSIFGGAFRHDAAVSALSRRLSVFGIRPSSPSGSAPAGAALRGRRGCGGTLFCARIVRARPRPPARVLRRRGSRTRLRARDGGRTSPVRSRRGFFAGPSHCFPAQKSEKAAPEAASLYSHHTTLFLRSSYCKELFSKIRDQIANITDSLAPAARRFGPRARSFRIATGPNARPRVSPRTERSGDPGSRQSKSLPGFSGITGPRLGGLPDSHICVCPLRIACSPRSPRPPSRGPASGLAAASSVHPALHRLRRHREPWMDPGSGSGATKGGRG